MAIVSLGKVAFRWRSTYSAGTTYMKQDVVAYLGSSYVCILDNTVGSTPSSSPSAWSVFAQGTTGISSSSGQIIYNNGSGLVALPAGTSGQVLTVDATGLPIWSTPEVRSATKVLRLPENNTNTQPSSYNKMGVIMTDGSIRAWGNNANYELGDGTTSARSYPTRSAFPPGFAGAAKLYYQSASCVYCIDSAGNLWAWGLNDYGQCANGNQLVTRVPFNTSADAANSHFGKTVVQVALACGLQSATMTLILCSDGTVHSCGYNGYGQLGLGDVTLRTRFQQVPVLSGITQIACGREAYTACYAVKSTGALYSWGYNGDGQLGDGTTTNVSIPTLRTGGTLSGKTITKVYGGYQHAFAIDSAGNLHAWGTNTTYGPLGNGTLSNQYTPVQSVTGGVVDVYAGSYDYPITYIKKSDNSLWACGAGDYWGNGVSPVGTNTGTFTQISFGGVAVTKAIHSGSGSYNWGAALLANGQVKTWGYNGSGVLGNGTTTNSGAAVQTVLTGNRTVTDICAYCSSSSQALLMLLDDGQVLTCGTGAALPEDDQEASFTPMPVVF
ncbi:Regulator of chromosome condensation, RCC1 [uncultured Caudovirales phage]|uniref:Regulator of chromosome condensation, RCC1 n=1 Tax=uncultured Caudovirales phage TaxID=2100421 RepID=A0A6J5KR69_9CAUD|nr:Regulator of chromosome condensation, RCC1 [uncultured Caudovirales phage]